MLRVKLLSLGLHAPSGCHAQTCASQQRQALFMPLHLDSNTAPILVRSACVFGNTGTTPQLLSQLKLEKIGCPAHKMLTSRAAPPQPDESEVTGHAQYGS